MNKNYYSYLDSIIMRSKRRRMACRYAEIALGIGKYALGALLAYVAFYFIWSMLCYVFPEW